MLPLALRFCRLRGCMVALATTAAVMSALLLPALAEPALVVVLRHGRKDRPVGLTQSINYNLSTAGFDQALQLARLVPDCLQQGRPLRLVSYGLNPSSGKNARSYQTLVPLAIASGVNIRLMQDAEQASEAIGRALRTDAALQGAVVVIAWEHRHLALLAKGLGWDAMPKVHDDDFDSLWLFRYQPQQSAAEVEVTSQRHLQTLACYRTTPRLPDGWQGGGRSLPR